MKNVFLTFTLLTILSFEVSAYGYNNPNPNTPPPPPPQYTNNGGFDFQNRYLKLSLGSSHLSDSDFGTDRLTHDETTFLPFTAGMGVENGPIAFELEFLAASNKIDEVNGVKASGSVSAVNLSGSVIFRGFLSPYNFLYAGVGLGTLYVDISDGFANSASGESLSMQGVLGAEFRPSQRIGFFAEYKVVTSLGLELEDDFNIATYDYDYTNSSLNFGFKMYY